MEEQHLIFCCDGKDCRKRGAKKIRKKLEKDWKGPKIQIIKTSCTDHCKKGPVIHLLDKKLTKLDKKDVIERLEEALNLNSS